MRATLDCHALVVGINDYQGGISPLQSAAHDAMAVSQLLASEHSYRVRCLIDAEATTWAILGGLDQAIEALSEESGFLFYFAGHGVALGDGTEGPQGFLLGQHARPADDASWLSMDVLRKALERLPAVTCSSCSIAVLPDRSVGAARATRCWSIIRCTTANWPAISTGRSGRH
jgi:hypothetical protein